MTTGKRALIVDDSRSARVILSRMLEQHGMAVDTAESAEQALEYLQQNRPDVIFMDHLMPGMDGFQAVQAIKSDVQTATIPLMMYTSQEGELYVSQARALGAVGVLPKTVRPVDVSRVLYQLHLLPDRRQLRSALFERGQRGVPDLPAPGEGDGTEPAVAAPPPAGTGPVEPPATATGTWAAAPIALSELQGSLRQSVQQLVKEQLAEQRRFLLATFEAFARRLVTEIKESAPKSTSAPPAVEPLPLPPPARQWWPVVLTALLAVLPAAVLGTLYFKTLDENRAVARQLGDVQAEVARLGKAVAAIPPPVAYVSPAAAAAAGVRLAPAAPGAAEPAALADPAAPPVSIEYVPYGETPFAGPRLERLRNLAAPRPSSATSASRAARPTDSPWPTRRCRSRSASWWAIRSTTRFRPPSASRWISRISSPRCDSAPAARSWSRSRMRVAAIRWNTRNRPRAAPPVHGTPWRHRTTGSNSGSCPRSDARLPGLRGERLHG